MNMSLVHLLHVCFVIFVCFLYEPIPRARPPVVDSVLFGGQKPSLGDVSLLAKNSVGSCHDSSSPSTGFGMPRGTRL